MIIQQNISLRPYNTFAIDAKAKFFIEINGIEDLSDALQLEGYPNRLVLGGGSNILITEDLDALVLHINLKGIEVVGQEDDFVLVKAMAGENWHQFVMWTLERDYGGLENLSLIPGNTGTAPIQNIGAYGVELKDVFHSCEAMDIATQEIRAFNRNDCRFGYRDSFFKNEGRGKYIILSVTFKLSSKDHQLHTSYGAIEKQLRSQEIDDPDIRDISNAVIAIRSSKLPDPAKIGNSGSFFKNPVLTEQAYQAFEKKFPDAPVYSTEEGLFKVPAGWLIEKAGFKGMRRGDAGVHEKQALVLVNYGHARGTEILDLSSEIQKKVEDLFGIRLEAEVNILKKK